MKRRRMKYITVLFFRYLVFCFVLDIRTQFSFGLSFEFSFLVKTNESRKVWTFYLYLWCFCVDFKIITDIVLLGRNCNGSLRVQIVFLKTHTTSKWANSPVWMPLDWLVSCFLCLRATRGHPLYGRSVLMRTRSLRQKCFPMWLLQMGHRLLLMIRYLTL